MSQPLDYFSFLDGELSCDGVSIPKLARKFGTPLYVYSEAAILEPLRALQHELRPLDSTLCFAVKANSNLSILRSIRSAGGGMDLVSAGELYRAEKAQVPGRDIVFSGVGKSREEMRQALHYQGKGIFSFNVESVEELELLNEVAKDEARVARFAFRFNPDVNPKTHPHISTGLKHNKFGLNRREILKACILLPRLTHVRLSGISIHIGSQLTSLGPLEEAFVRLNQLQEELVKILRHPLEFLDVGGGLGIRYQKESVPELSGYAKLVKKHFGRKGLRILLEPGRRLVGNAGVLVTEVLYRKKRPQKDFLIVDAGMTELLRPALYAATHTITPAQISSPRGKPARTEVVGPVCESTDSFGTHALPSSLNRGDLLAILSSGAYGFSMSSTYNSRPRAAEVLIREGGKVTLIRKRETLQSLIEEELL